MGADADAESMEFVVLALIFLVVPLSLLWGVDSRLDEKRWADSRRS